jgi:erythronate-4-phosphate dehydrogenase
VVDDVIPHTAALKRLMGRVSMVPGRDISPQLIRDADILLVRSITRVDESLLAGSSVRFVGTATAGIDHFDIEAIERLGIQWAAAPGSNALSVVEYVLSALALVDWLRPVMTGTTIGLVGLGEVGTRLAQRLINLGCSVVAHDPLCQRWPQGVVRADLNEVLRQPVVSLHASLHDSPPHKSRAMIDVAQAEMMVSALQSRQEGGLFINAGRGELMTRRALDILLESAWSVVLDTWPGEPVLGAQDLIRCDWVSPHIAGHSAQARARGSNMLAAAISRWSGLSDDVEPSHQKPELSGAGFFDEFRASQAPDDPVNWATQFLTARAVLAREDARIRARGSAGLSAVDFDRLRKSYEQPDEWTGRAINMTHASSAVYQLAADLGLKVTQ